MPKPGDLAGRHNHAPKGQYKTTFFTHDMIWEQYLWPADLEMMMSGNGYDFIMKPQPVIRITPPLPPQKSVILNKTGSTNGFGGYIAMVPGEGLGVIVLANKNYPNEARVKATYSLIKALETKLGWLFAHKRQLLAPGMLWRHQEVKFDRRWAETIKKVLCSLVIEDVFLANWPRESATPLGSLVRRKAFSLTLSSILDPEGS